MIKQTTLLPLVFLLLFNSCKKDLDNSFKDAEYVVTKKRYQHSESAENLVTIEKDYYNKNNQPIQISSFFKAYQFSLSGKKKYYYNDRKQLIKFEAYTKFGSGGLTKVYDTIYTYDQGLVKTKTIHDAQNKIQRAIEFFYINDALIKEHVDIPSYSPYWYEYEYDQAGLLPVKKMYNDLGLQRTYKYTYDSGKLVLEILEYVGTKDIFEYVYNNDLLIKIDKFEQEGTAQPALFGRDEFSYDQNGRIKKEIKTNYRVAFDPPVFTYINVYEY